jgi:hypothetical protein
VKLCTKGGCTNHAKKGGVCRRHEAYCKTNDESTAFGSEFEQQTTIQSQPRQNLPSRDEVEKASQERCVSLMRVRVHNVAAHKQPH